MTTKGDLKDDLAPFVDDIKIMAKLSDGTICDIGGGHYRWDRDYDEAVWVLDLTPRAKQFASSAQETGTARGEKCFADCGDSCQCERYPPAYCKTCTHTADQCVCPTANR